ESTSGFYFSLNSCGRVSHRASLLAGCAWELQPTPCGCYVTARASDRTYLFVVGVVAKSVEYFRDGWCCHAAMVALKAPGLRFRKVTFCRLDVQCIEQTVQCVPIRPDLSSPSHSGACSDVSATECLQLA